MKICVLDAETLGSDIDLSVLGSFGELTVYQSTAAADAAERIKRVDVAVTNKVRLDKEALEGAERLKLICVLATGFDNVDAAACARLGVAVCNVKGYSTDSVAQVTVATVLYLACRYGYYLPFVREGRYSASAAANKVEPAFRELSGKIWGVVGYGDIGRRVGLIAQALGCKLLVCKRTPEAGIDCIDIDTLCTRADIITLHTPLNDSTRGLIDDRRLSLMKKGVILVNAARGLVTDEKALAKAVLDGRLGGLGVDVYGAEPLPADHPLYAVRELPNVCLTPHMAWAAYEARKRCLDETALNIKAFLNGDLRNRVEQSFA